jgi:drug/metabolite transporter (DMT)-like permease
MFFHGRKVLQATRREIGQALGLALFSSAGLILQMVALAAIPASTSAFLTQLYVFFIPVWILLYHRRRPSLLIFVCSLMVLAGMAILVQFDWHTLRLGRGETETILSAVMFSGQILWLERPQYRGNNMTRVSLLMFGLTAAFCLPAALLANRQPIAFIQAYQSTASLVFLGLLVGVCTLVGYLLMNFWQPYVTASEAGLIYCAEPVFTSVYVLFLPVWFGQLARVNYPNEMLTRHLVIGGTLILLANMLLQWRPPLPPTPAAEKSD